jgi:hypothetical protein
MRFIVYDARVPQLECDFGTKTIGDIAPPEYNRRNERVQLRRSVIQSDVIENCIDGKHIAASVIDEQCVASGWRVSWNEGDRPLPKLRIEVELLFRGHVGVEVEFLVWHVRIFACVHQFGSSFV